MTFLIALALAAATTGFWDAQVPNRNADKVVRLFKSVCVDRLGRSMTMAVAVRAAGAGFRTDFAGDSSFGPVWSSPDARISATDHGHNHDGDECQVNVRRAVAPNAAATIAALRRQGLVKGNGEQAEFGATAFRRGETIIFVRYNIPEEATGVTEADAGLMLLIQRPAG